MRISGWLAAAVITLLSPACSEYDDPNDDQILTDYGTAHKYEGTGVVDYFFTRDDGAILLINNPVWDEEVADKQRVKLYYRIDGETAGTSLTTVSTVAVYNITLFAMIEVPVRKPVMKSSAASGDIAGLGDDPLERITKMFFSGGYLNVEYRIQADEEARHDLNLVADDTTINTDENPDKNTNGVITLYIRYDSDAGSKGISSNLTDQESEVSFDMQSIRELFPEESRPVTLEIVWRESGKGTVTKTVVYTLDPLSYKQIVGR